MQDASDRQHSRCLRPAGLEQSFLASGEYPCLRRHGNASLSPGGGWGGGGEDRLFPGSYIRLSLRARRRAPVNEKERRAVSLASGGVPRCGRACVFSGCESLVEAAFGSWSLGAGVKERGGGESGAEFLGRGGGGVEWMGQFFFYAECRSNPKGRAMRLTNIS